MEYAELSQLSKEQTDTIKRRGCVLIKNVVDDAEAAGWRKELEEYAKANPKAEGSDELLLKQHRISDVILGFPEDDKQFFML